MGVKGNEPARLGGLDERLDHRIGQIQQRALLLGGFDLLCPVRRPLCSPSRRSRRAGVAAWASGRGPADRPPAQRVGRLNALRILEGISCAECAVILGCVVLKRAQAFGCGTHHVLIPRPGVWAGRSALLEQSRVLSTGGFAAHGG